MRILTFCVVLATVLILTAGLSGCSRDGGAANPIESDADSDGVADDADNCPAVFNAGQLDTDGDTLGDACDDDDDNDGIADALDAAPLNPNSCADADGDGCDDCSMGTDGFGPLADNDASNDGPDLDGDGICDAGDADLTNGLPLVHYQFNSDDGETIADHGLARATARVSGQAQAAPDEEDRPAEAYAVSGSGNYITVDETGFETINAVLTDEMTLVMTFDAGSFGGDSGPILEASGSGGGYITLHRDSTALNLSMNLDGAGEAVQISTQLLSLNPWLHVALTYSRHTAKLYVNGNAAGLGYAEDSAIFDFVKLQMLRGGDDLAVSDFRIYDRSLKHGEIKALWNQLHAHLPLDSRHSDGTTLETDDRHGAAGQYSAALHGAEAVQFIPARFQMAPYREDLGALRFDGSNYLELDEALSGGVSTDTFSIAAWIKPLDAAGSGVIAAKEGWKLWQEGNAIKFSVYYEGGAAACEYSDYTTSDWNAALDDWIFVLASWDRFSRVATLYINGDQIDTASAPDLPMLTGSHPILIGAQYGAGDEPEDFWQGDMDDIRFFNKTLRMEMFTHPYQANRPGVKQLFEDGYLVRGYTDCAYPYEDCNPAADRVLFQYAYLYEDPEPADPANPAPAARGSFATGDKDDYDYLLDAIGSHIQGTQWFLPPRDQWFIYSRSTHNDLDQSPTANGPQNRILGLVDWHSKSVDQFEYVFTASGLTLNPSPDGELDHAGGLQAIGKYFAAPVDSNTGSAATSTVYSVLYNIDDFLLTGNDTTVRDPDLWRPWAHHLLDCVEKGGDYAADVLAAIVKDDSGRYLWVDGLYESSIEAQTDRFRFNISEKDEDVSAHDDGLALKPDFIYVGEIDLDLADQCWHLEDRSARCDNGNWNSGSLIAQTDGRIYLLLTGAFNQINLLEVRINKINSGVNMNQPWERVHLDIPFASGLTLKAGAGVHITRNGKLTLYTTSLSDGMDNDHVNWGRWDTFWGE